MRLHIAFLCCFAFVAGCTPSAKSNLPNMEYLKIRNEAEAGDKNAAAFILSDAQRGVPAAENALANHYADVYKNKTGAAELYEKDPDGAASIYWWKRAANHGYAPAAANLGRFYIYKPDGNQSENHKKAAKWYRMAAEHGFRLARYELFMIWFRDYVNSHVGSCNMNAPHKCTYSSEPPPLSRDEAYKWLRMAANQGHPDAALWLSSLSGSEKSGILDYRQAYFWVNIGVTEARSAGQTPDNSFAREADEYAKKITLQQKSALDDQIAAWKPAPMPWDEK